MIAEGHGTTEANALLPAGAKTVIGMAEGGWRWTHESQDACPVIAGNGGRILALAAGAPREGELFPWFALRDLL
jgi:hypothetical protein